MSNILDWIKSVIVLNGGNFIGKTRLQKTFYFLDSKGADLGLDFDYHRYGPYSEELSWVLSFVKEDEIKVIEKPKFNSVEFSLGENVRAEKVGALSPEEVKETLDVLKQFSSWELELAATIHYFQNQGMPMEKAQEETIQRKTLKASSERMKRATELLKEIHLL